MTGNEYQKRAMRTASEESQKDGMLNAVLGLNGEAGEIADIFKKHYFQGHGLDYVKVIDELGDVLWYIARMCEAMGISVDYVMENNINKLKKRYPEGFDAERSINRGGE